MKLPVQQLLVEGGGSLCIASEQHQSARPAVQAVDGCDKQRTQCGRQRLVSWLVAAVCEQWGVVCSADGRVLRIRCVAVCP